MPFYYSILTRIILSLFYPELIKYIIFNKLFDCIYIDNYRSRIYKIKLNNSEHLMNIYLNLYIKRAKISDLSPLKVQHNNLIKHNFLLYFKIYINSYSCVNIYYILFLKQYTFKGLFKLINSLINTDSMLIVLKNRKDVQIYYKII